MIHRVQNCPLGSALLNKALLQANIMITSATWKWLEKHNLGPVYKPLHLYFTHRWQKTVFQTRATSHELRSPIFKVFSCCKKGTEVAEICFWWQQAVSSNFKKPHPLSPSFLCNLPCKWHSCSSQGCGVRINRLKVSLHSKAGQGTTTQESF